MVQPPGVVFLGPVAREERDNFARQIRMALCRILFGIKRVGKAIEVVNRARSAETSTSVVPRVIQWADTTRIAFQSAGAASSLIYTGSFPTDGE